MAGLGSVDDRVSAYMGNTKPLEQRYAMTQDLLDLLALQKIKSQKDAAARQMQMQMAQQQAQNGEAGMTVAAQREKEVTDLTKNELAQQRGETANQQNAEQQAAMQKMMGGVASAPGAAMAAQPIAMAAGGIVGYAGLEGSKVTDPDAEQLASDRQAVVEGLKKFGYAAADIAAMPFRAASALLNSLIIRPTRAITGAEVPYFPMLGGGDSSSVTPFTDRAYQEKQAAKSAATPRPPAAVSEAQASAAAGSQAVVPPQASPQAAPAAPKPPGLPSLPGAAGNPAAGPQAQQVQPGAVGPANDSGTKLEAASLKDAQLDSQKAKLDEETRVQNKLALTPEQRGVYDQGISGLQKMYQEQYDPERQRQEGLKRFLIGAGGRRYGELGGGAASAMDYDAAQRASKLKEFGGIQDARTGLIDIDRGAVKEGIGAGQKAYEQTSATKRTGLDVGSRLYGEDVKSRDTLYHENLATRDKALDREIEKLKIYATNAATQAQRENLSFERARTIYASTLNKVEQLELNLEKAFNAGPLGMLLMQDPTKLSPEDKNRLEIGKLELATKQSKIRKDMEPVLESARQKLGMTGGGASDGFGDMKKVESKK
jgi:hypothetical protein